MENQHADADVAQRDHEFLDHPAPTPEVTAQLQSAVVAPPSAGRSAVLRHSGLISLQRSAGNAAVAAYVQREQTAPQVQDVVGRGGGTPLEPQVQAEMETRLGDDFSDVRIHTDHTASSSAAALQARAYTVGHEVVFGSDAYAPTTDEGRHTLAHELTHVRQQRQGPVAGTDTGTGVSISDPSDSFEQEAEATAESALSAPLPESKAGSDDDGADSDGGQDGDGGSRSTDGAASPSVRN